MSEANIKQGKSKMPCKVFGDSSQKKLKLVVSDFLSQGKAIIGLRYKVVVREDNLGVYKILTPSLQKANPKDQRSPNESPLIVTHFEPSFAALCFPCCVDNSVWSSFSLSITVPSSLQVFSCMPLSGTSEEKGFTTFQFLDTPPIPAYLVAFAIGNFFTEENTFTSINGKELPLRIIIPRGFYTEAKAKVIAKEMLSSTNITLFKLEKYFDCPYWLPKLDILAVPQMLLCGMENLGLCFLHILPNIEDDLGTTMNDLIHEVAHQWIGNFVGMSLGMKEGLVQHIEKIVSAELFPQKNKKPLKKKAQQVKTFSVNKGDTSSLNYQLMQDFYSQLNESYYQKCLKEMENLIMKSGEKVFQERLVAMLKAIPRTFIYDDIILQWITEQV